MAQTPSIPKGTRDFSPVEMAKRNYIFRCRFAFGFAEVSDKRQCHQIGANSLFSTCHKTYLREMEDEL